MENFNEIEKMFTIDSARKKKIGSNVHRMRGKGKKGGLKHGILLGQSKFDKPYSKNTKTQVSGFKEDICSIDIFSSFSEEKQKEILTNWLGNFSLNAIANGLGISRVKLENIKKELNVTQLSQQQILKSKGGSTMVDEINLDKFTVTNFDKNSFELLSNPKKYEVLQSLKKQFGLKNKDLAALIGVSQPTINTYISRWRKEWEESHESSSEIDNLSAKSVSFLEEGLPDNSYYYGGNNNTNSEGDSNFNYDFEGTDTGKNMSNKLQSISNIIKDMGEIEMVITIKSK